MSQFRRPNRPVAAYEPESALNQCKRQAHCGSPIFANDEERDATPKRNARTKRHYHPAALRGSTPHHVNGSRHPGRNGDNAGQLFRLRGLR